METALTRLKGKVKATPEDDRPEMISGVIRWLWPEIQSCLEGKFERYTQRQIHRALATVGLHMHYDTFTKEIRKLRGEEAAAARAEARRRGGAA